MENHRKLTVLGVILLLSTIMIFYYEENHSGEGFSYAYIPGIAMIAVFMASLAMINKDRFKESKSKK